MTKHEQIANIVAFLSILFGEDERSWQVIMDFNPDYIIDKFERYILSTSIEYAWGLHPALREHRFHHYIDKWELELKDDYIDD